MQCAAGSRIVNSFARQNHWGVVEDKPNFATNDLFLFSLRPWGVPCRVHDPVGGIQIKVAASRRWPKFGLLLFTFLVRRVCHRQCRNYIYSLQIYPEEFLVSLQNLCSWVVKLLFNKMSFTCLIALFCHNDVSVHGYHGHHLCMYQPSLLLLGSVCNTRQSTFKFGKFPFLILNILPCQWTCPRPKMNVTVKVLVCTLGVSSPEMAQGASSFPEMAIPCLPKSTKLVTWWMAPHWLTIDFGRQDSSRSTPLHWQETKPATQKLLGHKWMAWGCHLRKIWDTTYVPCQAQMRHPRVTSHERCHLTTFHRSSFTIEHDGSKNVRFQNDVDNHKQCPKH